MFSASARALRVRGRVFCFWVFVWQANLLGVFLFTCCPHDVHGLVPSFWGKSVGILWSAVPLGGSRYVG